MMTAAMRVKGQEEPAVQEAQAQGVQEDFLLLLMNAHLIGTAQTGNHAQKTMCSQGFALI